jgi:hypothetical protein
MARLTMRGADAQPPVGEQVVQDAAADGAGQVDDGAGDDVGGLGEQVAGGVQGDGEAAAAGVDVAGGLDRVGDGDAQDLVAGQQITVGCSPTPAGSR